MESRPHNILRFIQNITELLPIQIVEEAQEIIGQFDPAFSLTLIQSISIHNRGGVIQTSS